MDKWCLMEIWAASTMQQFSTNARNVEGLPKYIIHSVLFFCCMVHSWMLQAQDLALVDTDLMERAHTASGNALLSEQEQQVVLLVNLARMHGPVFVEQVLDPFMQGKEETPYTISLRDELMNAIPLEPLAPKGDLTKAAEKHAKYTGNSGRVGHDGLRPFKERLAYLGKTYSFVGESCDYGYEDALNIVLDLLIDEGIASVGHRRTLLHAKYLYMGVSIAPHRTYRHTCVIDLAGEPL